MKRQFCTRLTRLEALLTPDVVAPLVIAHPLPPDQMTELVAGQRIAVEEYRSSGMVAFARERLTADPGDAGVKCAPGEYVEAVIRDIHQSCCYRNDPGVCRTCSGISTAGSLHGPTQTAAAET